MSEVCHGRHVEDAPCTSHRNGRHVFKLFYLTTHYVTASVLVSRRAMVDLRTKVRREVLEESAKRQIPTLICATYESLQPRNSLPLAPSRVIHQGQNRGSLALLKFASGNSRSYASSRGWSSMAVPLVSLTPC